MSDFMNSDWCFFAFSQNKMFTLVFFILLAAIGSLLRWILQNPQRSHKFMGTFLVNVIASFLLGFLLGGSPSGEMISIAGTGFLGSFSTFSTAMMEANDTLERQQKLSAVFYLASSIVAGVAAALLGLEVGAR
ncbi:MAG: CrcB family protein [Acidimicrobiales bacterium]|nr:CrcB family protein [Acidimicrobiales bacterium]